MKKKIACILAVSFLSLIGYLCLWPVPIQPVSWKAPISRSYAGPHAVNSRLAGVQIVSLGAESAPEHIVVAQDGKLFASVAGGDILRMNPDGSAQGVFVNTGGQPLGLDFDSAGNLIVADAHKGLLSVSPEREITLLADNVGGEPNWRRPLWG